MYFDYYFFITTFTPSYLWYEQTPKNKKKKKNHKRPKNLPKKLMGEKSTKLNRQMETAEKIKLIFIGWNPKRIHIFFFYLHNRCLVVGWEVIMPGWVSWERGLMFLEAPNPQWQQGEQISLIILPSTIQGRKKTAKIRNNEVVFWHDAYHKLWKSVSHGCCLNHFNIIFIWLYCNILYPFPV